MWPLLISAPAFTYLISAVVMCLWSNSGPIERPFQNKKILERLVQAIDVMIIQISRVEPLISERYSDKRSRVDID